MHRALVIANRLSKLTETKTIGRRWIFYAIMIQDYIKYEKGYKHVEFNETSDEDIDHTHPDGDRSLARQPAGPFRNCRQHRDLRGLPADRARSWKHGQSKIYKSEKQVDLHSSDFDLCGDRSSFFPVSSASCDGLAFRDRELSDAVFQLVLDCCGFLREHRVPLNRNGFENDNETIHPWKSGNRFRGSAFYKAFCRKMMYKYDAVYISFDVCCR